MTKPEIIGYAEYWIGPVGGTIGCADTSSAQFVRMRPMYKPRNFHAKPLGYGDYLLHCRNCDKDTATVNLLPHDAALRHRCKP